MLKRLISITKVSCEEARKARKPSLQTICPQQQRRMLDLLLLMPATGRSCVPAFLVSGTVSAFFRGDEGSTCLCLRLGEQCLRSKITSAARVAHVLLVCFVAGNMDVNTPASEGSELIGNAAIVRTSKRRVVHKKLTCVCLRLPVVARNAETQERNVDLWPALK